MKSNTKGSMWIAGAVAVVMMGLVLAFGLNTANRQAERVKTEIVPTQAIHIVPTGAMVLPTVTVSTGKSLEADLNDIDSKISELDAFQKNIDNAINDKPIDTGL